MAYVFKFNWVVIKMVKVNKILFLETLSPYSLYYQNLYLSLKRFCDNIINFDRRFLYLKFGKEKMNQLLLEKVKQEQPDYIFTWLTWDELALDTLIKIRETSPNTKTVVFFGDDDVQFESYSRFYAMFFDYCLIGQRQYIPRYKKEGINNVSFSLMTNSDCFKPLSEPKKYEVTFVGSEKLDKSGRYDLVKYLKNHGVNIKVFGPGWSSHKDILDVYGGVLKNEEVVKVINQSKINLCFTKNNYGKNQLKGRILEVAYCKSFALQEYFSVYKTLFKEGKELVMFKDKKDLIRKINYYLSNEKERKIIAERAHKKALASYNLHIELENLFKKTKNISSHRSLPKTNKIIANISKENFNNREKLMKKIKYADYISFGDEKIFLPYKNYLQSYSIEKTGKSISCCDFYVNSKNLGDYLMFLSYDAFERLNNNELSQVLNIEQLMVKKDYFLKNISLFAQVMKGKPINFLNKDNTSVVSIPLLRLKKIKTRDYNVISKVFNFKFLYELYSLFEQKKIFTNPFAYSLVGEILSGKTFILRILLNNILNKEKWKKLNEIRS